MISRIYGLHFFDNGKEIRLLQISGEGRLRLRDASRFRDYWGKPGCVRWQVYETAEGHTFESEEAAGIAAANLSSCLKTSLSD